MQIKQRHLTRRDFIRGTVGTTLATSMLGVPWVDAGVKTTRASLVTVVRDKNAMRADTSVDTDVLQTMLDRTVLEVTGKTRIRDAWTALVNPDDIVGLVPTPFLNPTHEELVDVVKASIMKEVGVPERNFVMAQGGKRRPGRCTALISMPGLKAHWLTGIGTVIKNYIMYSGRPTRYHGENSSKLGEIWLQPEVKGKTRLVLVDALHPLCDKGPQVDPRYKWAYNGLISGTDPVAVERVCLQILEEKRRLLRGEPWPLTPPPICIEAADNVYGLGTGNLQEIKVKSFGWKDDLLI
ncbi:MAG: DUF362 domain-containing protein [Proteobacteria bacterium]|nr:DUF362 domain-containing protein [Pseudomonadota bacterium]